MYAQYALLGYGLDGNKSHRWARGSFADDRVTDPDRGYSVQAIQGRDLACVRQASRGFRRNSVHSEEPDRPYSRGSVVGSPLVCHFRTLIWQRGFKSEEQLCN